MLADAASTVERYKQPQRAAAHGDLTVEDRLYDARNRPERGHDLRQLRNLVRERVQVFGEGARLHDEVDLASLGSQKLKAAVLERKEDNIERLQPLLTCERG